MPSHNLKKLFQIVLIFVLCLGLTGCWDRIEVNDLAISMAASIDSAPNHMVRYSKQIAVPGQMGGSAGGGSTVSQGKPYMVVSAIGRDLKDAMQNIQLKMSRKIFLAHRRLFLIGEPLAQQGIRRHLDEMSRNPQTRLRTNVAITRGDTVKYLNSEYPFERVPTEALRKILYGEQESLKMDIKELMVMLATPGSDAMIPIITLESLAPGNKKSFRADGLAVLKGDRMVGSLSAADARGVLWLREQIKRGVVTVEIPGYRGKISMDLLRIKTQFQTQLHNGHPVIRVLFRPEVDVLENETGLDLTNPKNIALIEQKYASAVEQLIDHTLDILQHKYHADIVRFGDHVHHAYPRQWKGLVKNWSQEFSHMTATAKVDVKIRRIGMTGPSLELLRKEVR